MTQKQFASHLGVTSSLISQVERGDRKVSANLIQLAITAFELPIDYFEHEPTAYTRMSLNFRTKGLKASTKDAVIIEFAEMERQARKLLSNAPFLDVAMTAPKRDKCLSALQIEEYAQATRRHLHLALQEPINNMTLAVERAGIGILYIADELETESKIDGISSSMPGAGNYVVAIKRYQQGDRQRFTVAHELGHLVLHLINRPESEKVREEEANLFAGAFLVPKEAISVQLEPSLTLSGYAQLKRNWGVSIQALIRRAFTLGVIDKEKYTSLMIQLSSRGWRVQEPVDVPIEEPQLMARLLERQSKVISLKEFRKTNDIVEVDS